MSAVSDSLIACSPSCRCYPKCICQHTAGADVVEAKAWLATALENSIMMDLSCETPRHHLQAAIDAMEGALTRKDRVAITADFTPSAQSSEISVVERENKMLEAALTREYEAGYDIGFKQGFDEGRKYEKD